MVKNPKNNIKKKNVLHLHLHLRLNPHLDVQLWVESLGEKQNTENPEKINFIKRHIVVLANKGCCAISTFKYHLYLNLPRFTCIQNLFSGFTLFCNLRCGQKSVIFVYIKNPYTYSFSKQFIFYCNYCCCFNLFL
jgi:hypothetical protein